MVFYFGSDAVIDQIRRNLDRDSIFQFRPVQDPDAAMQQEQADMFLIGPDVANPVKSVQKVVAKDRHLSVVVLAEQGRFNSVKNSLQFSPFMGKNTSCVLFQPETDYTSVFELAQARTRQKRSFSKFNLADESQLSRLTSPAVKLENLGEALECAPIAVVLLDSSTRVIGANRKSVQLFPQLAGGPIQVEKMFPGEVSRQVLEMISSGSGNVFEAQDINGNHYEVSCTNLDTNGARRTLLLINDITERKVRDRRIEAILESLPQIAWTASSDGSVTYYTNGWFSYTNQTAAEALGDGWASVIHPDDLGVMKSRWDQSVRSGQVYQHAARFRRFDGEYRWHLNRAVPVYTGKGTISVSMWVGTSTDIHDQVLHAENLEKKVRERTRSLEEANAELEQFAYVSSHDLQEPLRKIHTFAHLVREHSLEGLDANGKKYIDKIIMTSTRMSKLLKDLLNYTKIHHDQHIERVNLSEVINSIREDLELLMTQKDGAINVGELPVLDGHHSQIKQLFYNLVNNALKFARPDVPPVVTITAEKFIPQSVSEHSLLSVGRPYWKIIVRDNGIGFDQKYADQIFTIFQRLHSHSSYEGTGIGLAICRKIVTNHKGEIFAMSSAGHGAEFHIILPENQVS